MLPSNGNKGKQIIFKEQEKGKRKMQIIVYVNYSEKSWATPNNQNAPNDPALPAAHSMSKDRHLYSLN